MPPEKSHQRPLLSAAARRSLLALAAVEKRTPSAVVRTLIGDNANRRTAAAAHQRLFEMLEGLQREVSAAHSEMLAAVHTLHSLMAVLTADAAAPGRDEARSADLVDTADRLVADGRSPSGADDAGESGTAR